MERHGRAWLSLQLRDLRSGIVVDDDYVLAHAVQRPGEDDLGDALQNVRVLDVAIRDRYVRSPAAQSHRYCAGFLGSAHDTDAPAVA